jgi:thiol-disulfide isomerase/thioredoxin
MGLLYETTLSIMQLILFLLLLILIIKLFFNSDIYSNLLDYIKTTKKENIKYADSLNSARNEAFRNINRVIEESFTSSSNTQSNNNLANPDGYITSYLNKTKRFKIMLYYKPNCSYCKTFMPIWSKILNNLPADVMYEEINCDTNDPEKKNKISENKISSVPSLVLLVDNNKKFYMGSRTYDDITRFLRLNGVNLVKRTFEDFDTTTSNSSASSVNPHCPAVSFDKEVDIANDNYMYQIFNANGQYGYASGGYNSDKLLTPFQAAYSTIDSYLSSLPDDTDPTKNSYTNINECANLYANNIINFGLCDIDQLNAIQGYQSNVSSGLNASYIDGTDYSGNSKVVSAIMNACGFNS